LVFGEGGAELLTLPTDAEPVVVVEGDALDTIRAVPSASIDAVVTDPPYPCIKREYGYWTEPEWFALMDPLVAECRRVLKPTGSAVFILQPNSEQFGRMRPWLYEFQAKWCREWGIVQDAYWWNYTAMPGDYRGLMRPSIKPCVWLGLPDCYRDMDSVLWKESESNAVMRRVDRGRRDAPSGRSVNNFKAGQSAARKGGVVAFNLIPEQGCQRWADGGGAYGHGASTPMGLLRRWVRYICPPDGIVLDPFLGSGTTAVASLMENRRCIGSERMTGYAEIARKRVAEAMGTGLLAL
jgi:site-specific DNA-methyltransferase (adenine-specific)